MNPLSLNHSSVKKNIYLYHFDDNLERLRTSIHVAILWRYSVISINK